MNDFALTAGVRIREEAFGWIGTRFVLRARIKGAGVDCVNLAAGILEGAGYPGTFTDLPLYRCDSGSHASDSALIAWFLARPEFRRLPVADELLPGDMLCFRVGRVAHHLGVSLGGPEFVHAMIGLGVRAATVRDATWGKRLVAIFRPIV